jgi:hypothetical protein
VFSFSKLEVIFCAFSTVKNVHAVSLQKYFCERTYSVYRGWQKLLRQLTYPVFQGWANT